MKSLKRGSGGGTPSVPPPFLNMQGEEGCAIIFSGKDYVELDWPGIEPILSSLLSARGISSAEEAAAYLRPALDDLADPFRLPDMDKAVRRIFDALEDGETICVYGDYDVDGVTATAILMDYFTGQNAQVYYYIPSRHGEGYGLNMEAVREIAERAQLLITVDCGITALEEAKLARALGLDLIVTDHHRMSSGDIPECCAVVDPMLEDGHCALCGAGVALKLVQALGGFAAMEKVIDLAAMGTIADIVPLRGENRVITKFGLDALRVSERAGIKALCWICGVEQKDITSSQISFLLAPRVNAGGRLGHSGRCVELLLSKDMKTAKEIAQELDEENAERRRVEQAIFEEADAIAAQTDFLESRIIIAKGEWNPGVIGLAASKLADRYHWPVILLSDLGEYLVGSGRSIKGLNLHGALLTISDVFERFGGHEQAAGFTLRADRYDVFRERLQETLKGFPRENYVEMERYDLPLRIEQIDDGLLREMEKMQPFGYGNPAPQFMIERVSFVNPQRVGQSKTHLKMRLSDKRHLIDAIAFKQGDKVRNLSGLFDVIGTPSVNIWNGNRTLQCEVSALRHALDMPRFVLNCAEHLENNLRIYIAKCLYYDEHHTETEIITDSAAARELLDAAGRSVQGFVLLSKTPAALESALEYLAPHCKAGRLQLGGDCLYDARAFSTAIYAGKGGDMPLAQYRRVILLDGDWGDAPGLSAIFPEARITALHTEESAAFALPFLRRIYIGVEEMRDLYRVIKRDQAYHARITNPRHIFQRYTGAVGGDALRLLAGLAVLRQMRLIDVQVSGGGVFMLPPNKCDIHDSALYRKIEQRFAECEAKGR